MDKNYKWWESELFGMIDKRAIKNCIILDLMEQIDQKIEDYNLEPMKEKDIKERAIATYERLSQAWDTFGTHE